MEKCETVLLEMLSKVRSTLRDIFQESELPLWSVCYPNVRASTATFRPPPSAKTGYQLHRYETLEENFQKVIGDAIGQGVVNVFSMPETLHNEHFWKVYFHSLWYDLSPGLSICKVTKNEAEVRHYLLTPLLKKTAHAASMTLSPEDCPCLEYCSVLGMETTLAVESSSKPSRKPAVDYTLIGYVESDALYVIPVEAKTCEKDIAQLSQYMETTGNGQYVRPFCTVGFLLDQTNVRFAFSVFALALADQSVSTSPLPLPLPVALVSPVLAWRRGVSLNRHVCVAMALLGNFGTKRVTVLEEDWRHYVGEAWEEVKRLAEEAAKQPQIPKAVLNDAFEEMKGKYEVLEEENGTKKSDTDTDSV